MTEQFFPIDGVFARQARFRELCKIFLHNSPRDITPYGRTIPKAARQLDYCVADRSIGEGVA